MMESQRQRRLDELHNELERIIWQLADLEPGDVSTVPVALPTDLAQLMSDQAKALNVPLSGVIVSYLMHGAFHTAEEGGEHEGARYVADIIQRISAPAVWQRFVQRHPEVRP
jgi:hypothetical protein